MSNDRLKFRAWDKKYKRFLGDDWGIAATGYFYNISEVTSDDIVIMQSTGLKDKNGNLIYEGDIALKEESKKLLIIEYGIYSGYNIARSDKLTIIGNIYENSELLENDN